MDEEGLEREEQEQMRLKEESEVIELNRIKALESQWSALDSFNVVEAQLSASQPSSSGGVITYKNAEKFFR